MLVEEHIFVLFYIRLFQMLKLVSITISFAFGFHAFDAAINIGMG